MLNDGVWLGLLSVCARRAATIVDHQLIAYHRRRLQDEAIHSPPWRAARVGLLTTAKRTTCLLFSPRMVVSFERVSSSCWSCGGNMRLERARATPQADPGFSFSSIHGIIAVRRCHACQLSGFLFSYKSPQVSAATKNSSDTDAGMAGSAPSAGQEGGCASYWLIGVDGPGARPGLLRDDVFNANPSLVATPVGPEIRMWRMMVCCAMLNEQERRPCCWMK